MFGHSKPPKPKKGLFQALTSSVTYTNLLDSIMPSSKHNAAKVAQTLGTPSPENCERIHIANVYLPAYTLN